MVATTAQVTRRGLLTLSVVAAGSLLVKPATTHAGSLWHTYSQTQRNTLIVNRGLQDVGANLGIQCKEWVRSVVASASGGAVYIPPTAQNGIGWYWLDSPDVYGMSKPFENLKPGEILQIHLRTDKGFVANFHLS
jgi:hypothetical protein